MIMKPLSLAVISLSSLIVWGGSCEKDYSLAIPEGREEIIIQTDRERYEADDKFTATVTFTNRSATDIYIHMNGCMFADFILQKFMNEEWKIVGGPICIEIAVPPVQLKSGKKFRSTVSMFYSDVQADTLDGEYRLFFELMDKDKRLLADEMRYSNQFWITSSELE